MVIPSLATCNQASLVLLQLCLLSTYNHMMDLTPASHHPITSQGQTTSTNVPSCCPKYPPPLNSPMCTYLQSYKSAKAKDQRNYELQERLLVSVNDVHVKYANKQPIYCNRYAHYLPLNVATASSNRQDMTLPSCFGPCTCITLGPTPKPSMS